MAYQHINRDWDQMLERFWEGKTNELEEQELKDFFRFGHVPEHLLPYCVYFRSMESEPPILDQNFDREMMNRISNHPKNKGGVFQLYRSLAVAATLIFVFTIGSVLIWKPIPATQNIAGVCEKDRIVKEAYEQTKQALFMLSSNMEKGESQMFQLTKFNQAHQRINSQKP